VTAPGAGRTGLTQDDLVGCLTGFFARCGREAEQSGPVAAAMVRDYLDSAHPHALPELADLHHLVATGTTDGSGPAKAADFVAFAICIGYPPRAELPR
jgi:hypothetical protein